MQAQLQTDAAQSRAKTIPRPRDFKPQARSIARLSMFDARDNKNVSIHAFSYLEWLGEA